MSKLDALRQRAIELAKAINWGEAPARPRRRRRALRRGLAHARLGQVADHGLRRAPNAHHPAIGDFSGDLRFLDRPF